MKKTFLFCAVFLFVFLSKAFAAFSISAAPYEGGFNLDFGKVDFTPANIQKEAIIRVSNDTGKRYRVLQTLTQPLTSSKGDSIPSQNFVVYSLRGSNSSGTLLLDFETPVTVIRTPIFVSNQQGTQENITLIYALKGPCSAPAGQYRGKLQFTLEAVDSPLEQIETYLDVFAEIENTSSGISVAVPDGMKTISVKSSPDGVEAGEVVFTMKNVDKNSGRITQVFSEAPVTADGTELPLETVTVKAGDAPVVPVATQRQVLFTTLPVSDGDVVVAYGLGENTATAGTYRSTLKYYLEGARAPEELASFAFNIRIEKIFDLLLKTESGEGIISFRDLKPGQPARTFEVEVTVKNNTGKKYQVTQKVLSGLVNKEGQAIPEDYFLVSTERAGETKGTLKFPAKTPIKSGDQVLFLSDSKGSSDSFRIVYELSTTDKVKAGDYTASVVYSLSEL